MIGCAPKIFKRGGDFSVVMTLPSYVADNHFQGWTPLAQLRRYQNDTASGLIATLEFEWLPDSLHKMFRLKHSDTDHWPLGVAELDVLFTSPDGVKTQTQTITITIARGISRGAA